MTDRPHDAALPASAPEQAPSRVRESLDAWLQAALSLGRDGLHEHVAVPSAKGGYRVVIRKIAGTQR